MKRKIKIAQNEDEIRNCHAVMGELRPHLEPAEFFAQVKRQTENSGFKLVYLSDGEVKAVGGIRTGEWLSGGKYLEIEDLVTKQGEHSNGYGGELFDWIVNFAKEEKCAQIKLVSHVRRFDTHRIFLNKKMIIEGHYFSMKLK